MSALKVGIKTARKKAVETLVISLMVAFSLSMYVTSQVLKDTLLPLFSNYLTMSYGDIVVLGYIPYYVDEIMKNLSWVKDFTGYAVVPSYGECCNSTVPLLLGYSEAAYRNDTLLGGFKAPNLRQGEAVLLKGSAEFVKPGMVLRVYPVVTLNPVEPFVEKVVGYAEGGLPLPAGPVLFLNEEDGERLKREFGGYTVYSVVTDDPDGAKKVKEVIKDVGGFVALVFDSKRDLLFYPGEDVILESSNVLEVMSEISWAVVTIVLLIVSVIYIERNVREVATLRSIGASLKDMTLYLSGVWGSRVFLGTLLALLFGTAVAISSVNVALSHPRLEPLKAFVTLTVSPKTVLAVFAMSALTTVLTILTSIIAISKMNLVEALRFYGLKVRLSMESSLPFRVMIAVSENKAATWRFLAAVVLLSLTLSLITIPTLIKEGLTKVEVPKYYDVAVTFLKIPKISPPVGYVLPQLEGLKGYSSMSVWVESLYGSVNFKVKIVKDGEEVPVYGKACLQALKGSCWDLAPRLVAGKYPGRGEIAVSDLLAHEMGLKVGDIVKVEVESKGVKRAFEVKVSGIFSYPMFPPTVILPKAYLPAREYSVMVIYVSGSPELEIAKEVHATFVSNAYAATSLTWTEFERELRDNLRQVALSTSLTTLLGTSIVVLALATFSFSDVVLKSRFLALLKSLGLTSKEYLTVSLTKWGLVAAAALIPSLLVEETVGAYVAGRLSEVYLIPHEADWRLEALLLLASVVGMAALAAQWYRRVEVVEEIKLES
ncbi:ABC transporter permease [Ignicoccus hospitalis]|uniref:ABC3 transporter permease C-terminal domain-containing protein n=1 Tax=Ignicoccus hospitalis (strain KIN4/I / DSM 18386 / JCM 14125) TaxID=453591 RepID=A8ABZ3_IGNH4|nr:FtsX-like permease family protein [Ignicoccus hospitalis]ABU82445.1 protein of unknown function DUF214 [Ignicoccus hospitalis KIN4/I]HIH90540.1 FtsX-like permease family protein [Desulfurococcaceae archaeon]